MLNYSLRNNNVLHSGEKAAIGGAEVWEHLKSFLGPEKIFLEGKELGDPWM